MSGSTVAVIGANFGDEGKGLITDFETRRLNAKLVARMNGGAQAGHTVVTTEGDRHVFGHFGAGTFAGADTYLPATFLVNPLVHEKEKNTLGARATRTFVHPHAPVSTIWDMALNAIVELSRDKPHGSCGLGINETVTRTIAGHGILFNMLKTQTVEHVAGVMSLIRRDWIPERIKSFGIDFNSHSDQLRAKLEPMLNVLNDLDFMRHAQRLVDAAAGLELGQPTIEGNLVIEGAQGLQLDQDLGIFPHVTRSMTGLGSAIVTANELGRKSVQPVYITRCYLTRHGAGPLEHEKIRFTEQKLFDQTNQPNQWQGTLRYAPLNLVQLEDFIRRDCVRGAEFASRMKIELEQPTIAVTCLDQVGSEISMFGADQELVTIPTENAASYIADTLKLRLSHSSRGPSAADVQFM